MKAQNCFQFGDERNMSWILNIDENNLNGQICDILSSEYKVISVSDGNKLIDVLAKYYKNLSCIIVSLENSLKLTTFFANRMSSDLRIKSIPVVVYASEPDVESEKDALRQGAWDFIRAGTNQEIIRLRIKNIIEKSKYTAPDRLAYIADYDSLTGIYNKNKFLAETENLINRWHDKKFMLIRFDINQFNLVNSFYGIDEGNRLLKYLAECIKRLTTDYRYCTYGRIEADIFGICISYDDKEEMVKFTEKCITAFKRFNPMYDIVPCFGLYPISDPTMPASIMLDRAAMAAKSCKGNYFSCYEFYNDEMRIAIEREQEIVNEMNYALNTNQFEVYIQPKYNIRNNTPAGGEALVRWNHPEKGMISPGVFIPVFEKNGFIVKLDFYVWEQVCIILRNWLDNGIIPHPISVNFSRVNLYNVNFVSSLVGLVDSYNIPHEIFNIELTESAYTDNPAVMKNAIMQLKEKGFIVLMDDFGSGYSSLNMLKEIPVDVLKIDMRFFMNTDSEGRAQNIVASVIRLSKWLNIPAIAEGVETADQVRFLKEIGCEYVQGFYFAKPMPIDQYAEYVNSNKVFNAENETHENHTELMLANSNMELVFSNMFQPMVFAEYQSGKFEIIRVNDAYYDMFNFEFENEKKQYDPIEPILEDYRKTLIESLDKAVEDRSAVTVDYQRKMFDGSIKWISLKIKYLDTIGEKHILMGCFTDITAQKQIEFELQKYRTAVAAENVKSKKMLIVDDMTVNREYLKVLFENDFIFEEAENGRQALEILRKNNNDIDLIMLDLNMPVMDGREFLKEKNADRSLVGIPVIVISAEDSHEQQANILIMGADDYIVKPFVNEAVKKRVQNVIGSGFRNILKKYNPKNAGKTDSLTGICNAETAEKLIDNILAINDSIHGFIIVDVDNLAEINEKYGSDRGDYVLVMLTQILKTFFRASDIIARIGGSEIGIFMNSIASELAVTEKCQRLLELMKTARFGALSGEISYSIGEAVSKIGDGYEELYARALKRLTAYHK